ncbi:hypothetical protein ASA1KI_00120 [Opitutales bacterium ASA1]|nr:hypothetical protein ASA1KI_00120 [Opitutales bacterium ASA1]
MLEPSSRTRTQAPVPEIVRRAEVEATLRWLDAREKGALAAATRRTRSALARRFDRLNAPVVYPWSPSMSGSDAAHRLHRLAATLLRVRSPNGVGRLWLKTKAAVWPTLAVIAAVLVVWRCARQVRERYGFSGRDQLRDVIDAALRHGIFPTEYYYRRVFATAARADKSLYLSEREMIALLSGADRGADTMQVDDLQRLYAGCRAAGLAVPRNVARFTQGAVEMIGSSVATVLPEKDLFFRHDGWSVAGSGQFWRWMPRERAWQYRGEALAAEQLLKRLRRDAGSGTRVLQEAIVNHPEVARYSQGALCSYKVATGVDMEGFSRVLFASFCIPGGDLSGETPASVDLVSGVDLANGRLLPAVGEFVADGEFESHPGTGAILAGASAPHWREVAAFATRAHAAFRDVPFVGWEIAVGASGPVLLGASTNWGFFPHVLPAETEFAELCLQHVRRLRPEEAIPAALGETV